MNRRPICVLYNLLPRSAMACQECWAKYLCVHVHSRLSLVTIRATVTLKDLLTFVEHAELNTVHSDLHVK